MLQLSLNVSKKSSFLKTRGSVEIEAELRDPKGGEIPVAGFLEQLFADAPGFIPEVSLQTENDRVEDLRGRPPETFEASERSVVAPNEEELFFGSGVLFDTDTSEPVAYLPHHVPEVPFVVRLGTRFESFKESTHIVHRLVHSTSPVLDELRPDLSVRMLARLFPARLDRVRLGLESFQPRTGALFGIIPTVTDRLYLELSKNRIKLRASCDYRGKTPRLPFFERGLLGLFDGALKRVGLYSGFSEQLANAL